MQQRKKKHKSMFLTTACASTCDFVHVESHPSVTSCAHDKTCACFQSNGKISTFSKQFHNQETHAQQPIGEFKPVDMVMRNHMWLGARQNRPMKLSGSKNKCNFKNKHEKHAISSVACWGFE